MYQKIRRLLALAAVLFLAGLYLAAFLSAVFGSGLSSDLFKASIFCSVVIPAAVYGFLLILRLAAQHRETQTDQAEDEGKGHPDDSGKVTE